MDVRASKVVGCGKVDKACCGGFRRASNGSRLLFISCAMN